MKKDLSKMRYSQNFLLNDYFLVLKNTRLITTSLIEAYWY